MQTQMLADTAEKAPWLTVHPLSQADSPAATALRAGVAPFKGKLGGTAAAAAERRGDHSPAWRLVQLRIRPRVPESRRAHRIERGS